MTMARAARLDAEPTPLPADVRLMNAVSAVVYVLAAVVLVAAALGWVARRPWFELRSIELDGELARSSVPTIRANAVPRLAGNFFSVDLQAGRAAFESVPWVRQAVVDRVWPNRLRVHLQEHRAAALWIGEDGNDRLVNTQGEIFEANVGDVEDDGLPRFEAPPAAGNAEAAAMLAMHRRLVSVFEPMEVRLDTLRLSGRGSWRVELDRGGVIELGRGSEDEVVARTERFVRTVAQVTHHFQRRLQFADLRHADGYAVRLEGITTTLATTGPAAAGGRTARR